MQHGENLVHVKGWATAPPEPAWSLSVVPAKQNSIISDQTDHTDANLEKMWLSKSALTQPWTYLSRGGFAQFMAQKYLSLQSFSALAVVLRREKSFRAWSSFLGELPSVWAGPPAPLITERHSCCASCLSLPWLLQARSAPVQATRHTIKQEWFQQFLLTLELNPKYPTCLISGSPGWCLICKQCTFGWDVLGARWCEVRTFGGKKERKRKERKKILKKQGWKEKNQGITG